MLFYVVFLKDMMATHNCSSSNTMQVLPCYHNNNISKKCLRIPTVTYIYIHTIRTCVDSLAYNSNSVFSMFCFNFFFFFWKLTVLLFFFLLPCFTFWFLKLSFLFFNFLFSFCLLFPEDFFSCSCCCFCLLAFHSMSSLLSFSLL